MPYTAKQVSDLQTLRDDPTYDGQDDATFLAAVNAATVSVDRLTNTQEVFNAFVGSELPARASDEWQNIILMGTMNSGGSFALEGNVLAVLLDAFPTPAADATRAALNALRTENISPAQNAGLPAPSLGDVGRTI